MIRPASRRAVVLVVALAFWSAGEAFWQLSGPGAQDSSVIAVLWALALPLPLLMARRAPGLAALAVVALAIARDLAGYRAPGAAAQSVVVLVALFLSEAGAPPRSPPVRGLAAGAFLLAGDAAMDLLDLGVLAHGSIGAYTHKLTLIIGGVAAGVALRDRRFEAEQREREVRELEASAEHRIDLALADERARIATEVDGAVAVLLHGVRPLADRARHAGAEELAALMTAVWERSQAAMLELRRAVRLLRAPGEALELAPPALEGRFLPPPEHQPAAPACILATRDCLAEHEQVQAAEAAMRRTRLAHLAGWIAPAVLLALIGLVDQLSVTIDPFFAPVLIPDPRLGAVSPWLTAVLCPLPLLARGRFPVAAAGAVFALVLGRMLIHDLTTLTFSQYYVVAAVAFIGAAHARRVTAGAALVAAGAATSLACMALEQQPYEAFAYSFAALLPVACGLGGLLVRDRVATARRARCAHEAADRAHEQRAREGVLEARLAAARELHDVVGHAVTIITLQAAVAVRYAPLDLVRARHAGAAVTQVASDVERDLVRLGGDAPPNDLARLVARSGLPVTLDQRTTVDDLPLPLALTTVRIVQEALTNVGRHAGPVPVDVRVELIHETLVIDIVNAAGRRGVGGGSGNGLRGMLERVELYGGVLEAGPGDDGGWRVRAELPVPGPQRLSVAPAAP